MSMRSLEDRFEGLTEWEPNSGCRLWTASANERGYGLVKAWGRTRLAHRVAWVMERGPIPKGLQICHRCDTPSCVNVQHFFLGTQAENLADMIRKGRSATGDRSSARRHPEALSRGERHKWAKLTEEQVKEIRRDYVWRSPTNGLKALGRRYDVDHKTIWFIVARKTWMPPKAATT